MKVDLYERIWMYGVVAMLALFFGSTAWAAFAGSRHPPSHVETIDPATVLKDPRFAVQGVSVDPQGKVHARVVALMFAWLPARVTLPAHTAVTFHITALDVNHGFEIVRTNGQTMAIPGYVSQFTTEFEPGEYLVACNEYCGVGHHLMFGKLIVVPREKWQAPATTVQPVAPEPEVHHDAR